MPDIWFVFGVATGTIVTGFVAIGSFARGADSVHRRAWGLEHASRRRAFLVARTGRALRQSAVVPASAAEGVLSKAS